MSDSSGDLHAALAALAGPLRFAARDDFARLERVRELEPTVRQATDRLHALLLPGRPRALVATLREAIPPQGADRETRVTGLRRCVALLGELEVAVRASDEVVAPAPGPIPVPVSGSVLAAAQAPAAAQVPAGLTLDAPLQFVKGVGPKLAERLAARQLVTVHDLLRFLPRRYEERREGLSLRELRPGMTATVDGVVTASTLKAFRGRRTLDVVIDDGTGRLHLKWFRVPGAAFAERFERGVRVRVSGPVTQFRRELQIVHPESRVLGADEPPPERSQRLQPVYLEIEGLAPTRLRTLIASVLPLAGDLEEVLPDELRERRGFATLGESIAALHQPPVGVSVDVLERRATPWHRRLIYEELFFMQLVILQRRAAATHEAGRALVLAKSLIDLAGELLPFALTRAQARVLTEIDADVRRAVPMHRLLQGDVGCGKTAVALTAATAAARAGHQACVLAPTEVLAEQHARNASSLLHRAGVRTDLLTGHVGAAERRGVLARMASGEAQVIIGTHALLQPDVRYRSLALAVVDEQHRFGVLQRAQLAEQGRASLGVAPHVLVMTATPIPRTLALTIYGDLDTSVIDELPPGRTPVRTQLFRSTQREQVYARVRQAVLQGRQAYVVFPLVDESDSEGMEDVRAATTAADELAHGALHGLRVALLHGRLSSDEKDRIMRAFGAHEVDVLVATTVIEVGVDVANASVIVIEHAERFGLAQLHQLRGRVGRGRHASECLLVADHARSDEAWQRLKVMEQTQDGFRIAEEDLAIRGPGDLTGTRQSGLPVLSFANLARDQAVLEEARIDAEALLAEDPHLRAPQHEAVRRAFAVHWEHRLALVHVG